MIVGIADLKVLLPHAQDIPISANQVEVHPWFPQKKLIAFHNAHGIVTTCFSPFAGQKADGRTLIHDPTVQTLAKKSVSRLKMAARALSSSTYSIRSKSPLKAPRNVIYTDFLFVGNGCRAITSELGCPKRDGTARKKWQWRSGVRTDKKQYCSMKWFRCNRSFISRGGEWSFWENLVWSIYCNQGDWGHSMLPNN